MYLLNLFHMQIFYLQNLLTGLNAPVFFFLLNCCFSNGIAYRAGEYTTSQL